MCEWISLVLHTVGRIGIFLKCGQGNNNWSIRECECSFPVVWYMSQ